MFSIEASRLARNGRDWHTLLEFCGVVDALLLDAEGIYDPKLANDRLLLGMKGTISETGLASFRGRAQAALTQKAQRGALFMRVPIGHVKAPENRVEKDPDGRVRVAIELIFRKFAELGSVRQVFFWLSEQQILLPVAQGREQAREAVWRPARYRAVLSVLKNPLYAGVYAYGRSKTVVRLDGQRRISQRARRRRDEWSVLIPDHHEGYIGWGVYQRNQAWIAENDSVAPQTLSESQISLGGRRPSVDGFLVFLKLVNNAERQAPVAVVLKFSLSGETVDRSTFSASLNGVDVTASFQPASAPGDLTAVFSLGSSPLVVGRTSIVTMVEGLVPETSRTATDADRITFTAK